MDKPLLKQQCPLFFVALAWTMYFAGIAFFALSGQWLVLGSWVVVAPLAMWAYIHWFSALAPFMGYGRLTDRTAALVTPAPLTHVTLYTAVGCPFCPIVRRRLLALQSQLGFEVTQIDVTARPDILIRKNIWAVPVVEVDGRTLVGHATTQQIADLVAGRVVPAAA